MTVCSGMNGCQLAGLIAWAANTMNSSTTATFTNTMMLLKFADSLMPTTSSVVTRAIMTMAGKLKMAVTWGSVLGSTPLAVRVWSSPSFTAFQPAAV